MTVFDLLVIALLFAVLIGGYLWTVREILFKRPGTGDGMAPRDHSSERWPYSF